MRRIWIALFAALLLAAGGCSQSPMRRIVVSPDGGGFVQTPGGKPWRAWGVNYDHDRDGALLEDYWEARWEEIVEDFAEMRQMGVNVVRIHPQFNRFMRSATEPNQAALAKLADLLKVAERNGIHLDITGLGVYHKQDTPAWYDRLDEKGRWEAQANYWRAIAGICAGNPVVFCYDLMNEPVSPAGKAREVNWTPGNSLGGKFFVQLISLDQAGRERHQIARQWIRHLTAAIREIDKQTLITVGMVDWSLDNPGKLRSGFVPDKLAGELDFIAVHLYPKSKQLKEDMQTLRGFNADKPVIVEETFVLGCGAKELEHFMRDAEKQGLAQGWIGFYWGARPDELRGAKDIGKAITLSWLELLQKRAAEFK